MISIGNEGYKEETDKILYNILKKDVDMIDVMRSILNETNNYVNDDLVRDTLKIIIKVDEDRTRNKLNTLRSEITRLSGRRKTT